MEALMVFKVVPNRELHDVFDLKIVSSMGLNPLKFNATA